MLSREYGYTRTQITLFILLSIITGLKTHWILLGVCVFCVVLFSLTAHEKKKKIITTVNKYLARDNENSVEENG
jgi:hypothetical protein